MVRKTRMSWTRLGVIAVLLAGIVMSASCARPTPIPEPTAAPEAPTPQASGRGIGGTLRILYWQAPSILNPHFSLASKDYDAARVTYEPLASFDKDGNLIPFLAAEIPSLENGGVAADGRSVTWTLRQDVKWSDGAPFTAEDVRFTYEFVTNPDVGATSAATYADIESVEVLDDYTVRINFSDVNPAWALPFTGSQGMILPRHLFQDYLGANAKDAPANMMPVGTGPYHVVSFKPQEVLFLASELVETVKIVYEPNPYFREPDKPYFSRVELRGGGTATEAARAVLQYASEDYAAFVQVDASTRVRLEAVGKGTIVPNPVPYVERIVLNFTDPDRQTEEGERSSVQNPHPIFGDERVRQALTYAIDRDAIARLYLGSKASSNVLVSPASFASPNTEYEFSPQKAIALLEEAGWVDGDGDGIREKDRLELKLVFETTVNPVRQQTIEIVADNLRAVGIEVEPVLVDSSDFFDPASSKGIYRFQADMLEFNDGNLNPDPGAFMKYWTCDQIPQMANDWTGENIARWCNPRYDELYRQSRTEIDPEKRRLLFIEMNDLLVQDVVKIPLVHLALASAVRNELEGVMLTPWDADLWNIKDWRRVSP